MSAIGRLVSAISAFVRGRDAHHWFHIPLQVTVSAFCVYWYWNVPPPNKAVLWLGGVAALMLLVEMCAAHKVIYFLLIIALMLTENRAIDKDRRNFSAQEQSARGAEKQQFSDVGASITDSVQKLLENSDKHFDATMQRSDNLYRAEASTTKLALDELEETEGGDGFCFLQSRPPFGLSPVTLRTPWPMIIDCEDGKRLPIVDVFVMAQEALSGGDTLEEIDRKMWGTRNFHLGTLRSGGWLPTDIQLEPGRYNISIFTRKNAVLEQLSFSFSGPPTADATVWNEKTCVYSYGSGKLLSGSKSCSPVR